MARFGGFETVREVFRSGLATVWSARPADSPPETLSEFVIKEFRPLDSLPGDEAAAEVELFLDSAAVQQQVAESGAENWAVMHECGRCEGGAYYVTKFYHRSLHQLVGSRVRFSGVALGTIIDAVVRGLAELQAACNRPHGDLKPSNVLIETAGDLTRTRIVLTDPLASSQLPKTAGQAADVRAVGHIIYRLVTHRRFAQLRGWPIAKSDDWRRLGGSGEAWRHLCERLLDPEAPAEHLTLDWLAGQVARVRRGKVLLVRLAVAAVAVAVLAVGAWFGYTWMTQPVKPDVPPFALARWQRLCNEFYNWFGPLHGSLTASRRARWREDAVLAGLIDKIEAAESAKAPLDPRDVVGDRAAVPMEMAEKPPDEAQSLRGIERTVAALKTIDEVRGLLSQNQWPKLKSTADLASEWRTHDWQRPADYLQSLVRAIDPPPSGGEARMPDPQAAGDIDRVLALHGKLLPAIQASHQGVQGAQKVLNEAGDEILKKLDGYWREQATSKPGKGTEDDLRELQIKLSDLGNVASALATFVQGDWLTKVDRPFFIKDSTVHTAFDGTVTSHTIRHWREQVQLYYRLAPAADPRKAEDWDKRLARITTDIATLKHASSQGPALAAEYGKRLTGEILPAVAALRKLPAVLKTRAGLQKETAEAKAKLDALGEEVARAIIVYMGKPRDWLESILRFEFKSSEVVNGEWKRRRGQLLVNITAEELEAKNEKYRIIRPRVDALQSALASFARDEGLPRALPEAARKHGSRAWYNAFVARLAGRRERTLEAGLGVVPWEGAVPELSDPEFTKSWAQMTAQYRGWRDAAASLIGGFGAIEDALDACYLLDETPPGLGEPLGKHHDAWLKKPILQDAGLRDALQPVTQRVAALRKVAALADRKALAAEALRTRQREVALAAWRRLGAIQDPAWPSTAAELRQDGEIRGRLADELRVIRDAARRKTLQDAVATEAARRAEQWLALENQRLAQHIQKAQAIIEGTRDKVLAGFGAYVKAELDKARPQGRKAESDKLTEIRAVGDKLAAFIESEWATNVEQEKFARESKVHSAFDGTVTRETLAAWLAEVEGYKKATAGEVIAAVKAVTSVSESPAINAQWAKRRDLLLLIYPLGLLKADSKLLATVRVKLQVLQEFLRGLDDPKALPKGLTAEARQQFPEATRAALTRLLARRREQALVELVPKITWGEDGFPAVTLAGFQRSDVWKTAVGSYADFRTSMATRMAQAQRIPALLDAGYLPDDKPEQAAKTIDQLYADWQKLRDAVPDLRGVLAGVDERTAAIKALDGLSRGQLVARVKALGPGDPPQVPMVLWRRLGTVTDWPGDLAELALEVKLRETVAGRARRLGASSAHAVRWVAPAMAKEGPRRWEACFRRLLPKGMPTEADEKNLDEALRIAAATKLDARQLSHATLLRLHLHDLRPKLFALPDRAEKEQAASLITAFQRQVAALPDVGQRPEILQFFRQADEILKKDEGATPGHGLARTGPALYPHAGGWRATPSADGKTVTYTWAKGHSLHFALVDPTGGKGRPSYLCTTEMSLGLFIDIVAAANQWDQVIRLLKEYDLIADPRKGPRVWELTRDRKAIQPSKTWLVPLPGVRHPYPAGLNAGRPSREHPMQYVSPEAALYAARLLGCRLPTAAEWRAAAAADNGQKANLRDRTWRRQQAHILALVANRVLADWPDAGIFLPEGVDVSLEGNAGLVADTDDGVLWFAPVGSSSAFQHLVGNVAEMIFETPAAFEAAFQDPGGLSWKALSAFVDKHGQMLAVVGASALSAPELWNGREKAFGQAYPVVLDEVRDGLSDVGFRLAFTAPTESVVSSLKRFVRQQGYMMQIQ